MKELPLSEILTKYEEKAQLSANSTYKQVTVRLHGKGVVERGEVAGLEVINKPYFMVREGQFILSRIDARNGAFGLVPASLDGAIVTRDFPSFEVNQSLLLPEYMLWLSKTPAFIELCQQASEGTTNRVRLQESRFLRQTIEVPPLAEQRRIVGRIEELAGKVEEARRLRVAAAMQTKALLPSVLANIFDNNNFPERSLIENNNASVIAGQHIMAEEYNYSGEGYPYITGPADFGPKTPTINRWTLNPKVFCQPGDVLLTVKGAGVGKTNYAPDFPVVIGRQLMAVRPNPTSLLAPYIYYYLLHKFQHFQSSATATTVPGIKKQDIENLIIPVPSVNEQQTIVNYLDNLLEKIEGLSGFQEMTKQETDALLPAVLDKAFKGEL